MDAKVHILIQNNINLVIHVCFKINQRYKWNFISGEQNR